MQSYQAENTQVNIVLLLVVDINYAFKIFANYHSKFMKSADDDCRQVVNDCLRTPVVTKSYQLSFVSNSKLQLIA